MMFHRWCLISHCISIPHSIVHTPTWHAIGHDAAQHATELAMKFYDCIADPFKHFEREVIGFPAPTPPVAKYCSSFNIF